MKKYFTILISIVVTLIGCGKTEMDLDLSIPTISLPVSLKVLEKSTHSPISGATVYFQKCSNYDNVFGCVSYSVVKYAFTNNDGVASIQSSVPIESIEVKKTSYWDYFNKNVTDVELVPKGVIELSVKKENSYNSTDKLYVGLSLDDSHSIGLPSDTTIYLDGYGNMDNIVNWYINTPNSGLSGSSPSFHINGFDTARVTIKY